MLGVNLANGVSIRESVHLFSKQIKSTNIDPNVSWPGHFLKYEDRGRWPLFIIYSKKDKLLPWQFLKKLVEGTSKNGRQVEEWQLKGSYNEWVNIKQLFLVGICAPFINSPTQFGECNMNIAIK